MRNKQKKIAATATAAILVLALGLAGTFAASGSDESDGGFGDEVETGMFLHDDFSTAFTGSIRDRDVYVENTGDTSLYVRMRLDEYMKYGGRSLVAGAKQEDKATWTAHIPAGKDVADCTTGIHDFFTIQMGNDMAVKYKPKTKNAYNPALTEADKTKTTPTAEVVLIEDYLKAKAKPASCWVLDNKDGYAYWHTQLKKDSATGLVLNSITDTGLIDESYYYGINAKAEAVTEADLNAWLNGTTTTDGDKASNRASENAARLLKRMSPKYTEITEEMKNNGAADYDSDNDGFLTKKENAQYEAEKGVTSTPTPEDPDVKEAVKTTPVGGTVKLTNKDGSKTECIVYNKTADEADLITLNCITKQVYHESIPYPGWPASKIRTWLNDGTTGYLSQLSEEVKAAIKPQELTTASVYNNWTDTQSSTDNIYLLTETGENSGKVGKTIGADVTLTTGQLKCSNATADGQKVDYWWLRSPHPKNTYPDSAAGSVIVSGESIYDITVTAEQSVRPAFTLSLN